MRYKTPVGRVVNAGVSPKQNYKLRLSPLGHVQCTDIKELQFINELIDRAPNLGKGHIYVNNKKMNEVKTNYHEKITKIIEDAIRPE